jgi:hypothetical protein
LLTKVARFIEFLAFVLEDVAERVDVEGAKKEANKQIRISRDDLVDKV